MLSPSYALGLVFIFSVSIIWSLASILVQFMYHDMHFDSPFLVTYVGVSLFVVLIPQRLLWERRSACSVRDKTWVRLADDEVHCDEEGEENLEASNAWNGGRDDAVIPWSHPGQVWCGGSCGQGTPPKNGRVSVSESVGASCTEIRSIVSSDGRSGGEEQEGTQTASPNSTVDAAEATPAESRNSEAGSFGNPMPSEACANDGAHQTVRMGDDTLHGSPAMLSHLDHISMALRIAPVWFISNYLYNLSLDFTSITSSTVLASTGSLFTFLFATVFGDESFTGPKLAGVVLCFAGSLLTGLGDSGSSSNSGVQETGGSNSTNTVYSSGDALDDETLSGETAGLDRRLLGDLAGLIAAMGYGTYTVLIRSLCPQDESRMSMQLLLGYIGVLNMVALSPFAIHRILVDTQEAASQTSTGHLNFTFQETTTSPSTPSSNVEQLTWIVFAFLVVKGLLDNVLSDYLWARAVVLTSATAATVGLGLTIPLAFVGDWIMGLSVVSSLTSVSGALAVLVGFVLVNISGSDEGGEDSESVSVTEPNVTNEGNT